MILAMVRTPLSYFDLTPTGQIINKFANDLGQIDNMMPLSLILVFEKIALWIIMVGNIGFKNMLHPKA
jgi:ABC-type multidrug transport system fused ATPase/permease subunit